MKGMFALIALAATPVFAQEVQTSSQKAPTSAEGALEITLGAGYAQGFGDIGGSQRSLTDLNSAGGEVIVGAGYRIDRHLFVGAYGSGGKYSTADLTNGADIWTATAGAQANYHFLPDNEWDPWVGLASGWRGHWVKSGSGTDSRHGWDIARSCGRHRPIPPALAAEMLEISRLVVTADTRYPLFAAPVPVPAVAGPGAQLLAFLGRNPE